MEKIYAPWRSKYMSDPTAENRCPFCLDNPRDDEKKYIIKRFNHVYLMLNLYPYNAGHVMVIPYKHSATLHELDAQTRAEMIEVAATCEALLWSELKADGFNIGLNIGGKSAGGTVPEHLHLHILPRFAGDTNFLPLLSNTKQIALDLNGVYRQLKKVFNP